MITIKPDGLFFYAQWLLIFLQSLFSRSQGLSTISTNELKWHFTLYWNENILQNSSSGIVLDGYIVIILIERMEWVDLGTNHLCKDKLPHGRAQAGFWGLSVSDSYCGDVLGSTLGPALEVQCAQWMPIFPLLLLFPFTVTKITPTGSTIQKKKAVFSQYEDSLANEKHFSWNKKLCNWLTATALPCKWEQKQPHISPHCSPLLAWAHCSYSWSAPCLVPTTA